MRPTNELVLLMVGATVCACVIATVVAIAMLAPSKGINMEIVGMVYRVIDTMLGAVLLAIGYKVGKAGDA